mgnify:CR=1 FL=1
MSYSFEYIDIILLAMIAGFIFLRLRGILGKRTGFEGKSAPQFQEILTNIEPKGKTNLNETFDDKAQKEFLKGAKIAYETIITDFSDNDNRLIASKPLLSKRIYDELKISCQPVAINSGHVWPKTGYKKSNKEINISILPLIDYGIEKDKFVDDLQNQIF